MSKLGCLKIVRLDDDITATPDNSGVDFETPNFFYAVEEIAISIASIFLSRGALKPRTSIPFAVGQKQREKEEGKAEDKGC